MTTVGVTGHRALAGDLWPWVRSEIDAVLDAVEVPLVGVSGLAEGADQCFADAVLAHGGRLHAVLAFVDFRDSIEDDTARVHFDALLERADEVDVVAPQTSREAAYSEVGRELVARSELLVAVWDGEPARGVGGTAEVVAGAVAAGTPVVHVDTTRHAVVRL